MMKYTVMNINILEQNMYCIRTIIDVRIKQNFVSSCNEKYM